jgi:hypothetical protein
MEYRLLVIGKFIVAQGFSIRWFTLSKSQQQGVDGLAIWLDTAPNRKRAEKLFDGWQYQIVQSPHLWEAQETARGWAACTGTAYLPETYSEAKEAIHALAQLA